MSDWPPPGWPTAATPPPPPPRTAWASRGGRQPFLRPASLPAATIDLMARSTPGMSVRQQSNWRDSR
eukprot:4774381-Alexandrium_andersonii.AAC.1